jgi:hypothetical protein
LAKKLKIIELTSKAFDQRWGVLRDFLMAGGVDLATEIKVATFETLKESVHEIIQSDAHLCRIDDVFVPYVSKLLPNTTYGVDSLHSTGLLVREKQAWWPKPLIDDAFTRSVSARIGQVDLNAAALVIGSQGSSKLVVSSLVRMGFFQVNIADHDKSKGDETVKELRKKFFDTKFDYIPTQDLTLLPGVHSIVVNTNPLSENDELYAELHFFNYLKPGGVVVDLTLVPSRTPLIIEAEHWGANYLEGDQIATDRDLLMVEEQLKIKIDPQNYRIQLRKIVDAVPFDPAPYLKRFQDRGI